MHQPHLIAHFTRNILQFISCCRTFKHILWCNICQKTTWPLYSLWVDVQYKNVCMPSTSIHLFTTSPQCRRKKICFVAIRSASRFSSFVYPSRRDTNQSYSDPECDSREQTVSNITLSPTTQRCCHGNGALCVYTHRFCTCRLKDVTDYGNKQQSQGILKDAHVAHRIYGN